MPPRTPDANSLNDLSGDLQAIALLLQRWRAGATAGAANNAVTVLADRFADILNELRASGPNGEHVRDHLLAIAQHLEAAGTALKRAGS